MSILTRVVEDLLGKYLSDVQDVKIVDIANGHLSLSNLEIRSSALMSTTPAPGSCPAIGTVPIAIGCSGGISGAT